MTFSFIQKAQVVAFFLLFFSVSFLTAQASKSTDRQRCGTPSPTADQIRYTLDVVAKKALLRNAGTTCIPLYAHVVKETDGTGGITKSVLNRGLSSLNIVFKPVNIEFYWAGIDYNNNSDYYKYNDASPDNDTEIGLRGLFTTRTDAVNVYYVDDLYLSSAGRSTGGYSVFPSDTATPSHSNIVVMANWGQDNDVNGSFAHEFGHYFNLFHTHEGTENGPNHDDAENVARVGVEKNCDTKGDLFCDTQADPSATETNVNVQCVYTGGGVDRFNRPYTPPVDNIMSYFPDKCGANHHFFTPNQNARIEQALITRQTHGVYYTFNAPPMAVINPSGLMATQSALSVVLNWADNADNEMGYLIERSTTSNNAGFTALPFGATGDNETTFTDANVVANTTYFYRIKASNDGCNDYSNVVAITPIPVYCVPTYTNTCFLDGDGTPKYIGSVRLSITSNVVLLENNNGNCLGGLSDHTALSANVVAGTIYNIEIEAARNGSGNCYPQKVGIWLDINNDKDFDDAGEYLGNGTMNACDLTIGISVPVVVFNGSRRLRIRSIDVGQVMSSAAVCGDFPDGETEDYTLNITATALPINLISFEGKNTEGGHQLTWRTESEVNASHFEVERSLDGQKFDKMATVKAFSKANTYALMDKNITQNTQYYRLKMVDLDGAFKHSKIIALNAGKHKNVLTIFPNPTTHLLTIETTEEAERHVINLLGQTVLRSKAAQQIDVSALPLGTYFLKVGGQQARFVKQ